MWAFQNGSVQLTIGDTHPDGRVAVTAAGPAVVAPGALAGAAVESARQQAEILAAARARMRPELDALARARGLLATAKAEAEAATAGLEDARRGHQRAILQAENPGVARRAVQAAEDRLSDAAVWERRAEAVVSNLEVQTRNAAVAAWGAATSERAAVALAAVAEAVRGIEAGLAALLSVALAVYPTMDAARTSAPDSILDTDPPPA